MRDARAEHRLSCPSSRPSSAKASKRKPGTIVRIDGLQSEAGMRMNNKLAEVLHVQEDTGRIHVALTLDKEVKLAAIKPENVAVELSVPEAAKKSMQSERKARERDEKADIAEYNRKARQVSLAGMSAVQIVHHIGVGDVALSRQ